jgi:hypothetical protein
MSWSSRVTRVGCYAFVALSFDLPLPAFHEAAGSSEHSPAASYLRELLCEAVPGLDIVAVARRPGVHSKVAVRDGLVSGAVVASLREQLDGERIDVVQWQARPQAFVSAALGLVDEPPMLLKPAIRHAHVYVGEIDALGLSGWRGINRLLASSLTGWRIHLEPVGGTPAWRSLHAAFAARRAVSATVLRGTKVEMRGLYGYLRTREQLEPGAEVRVVVTRMDADEGRIVVARERKTGQLALPRAH